jgi:glycosyltransferase involved in cell wall biosynthesis
LITVVAISSEQDYNGLDEWIDHLPASVNKVVVKTVKGGSNLLIAQDGNTKIYEWGYTKFRFDEARNYALSKVETDWCIMLDMDERLQIFDKDIEFISSLPNDVYGAKVRLNCFNNQGSCGGTYEVIRVMRKDVRYSYYCHETPHKWIEERGYNVVATPLNIRHDSYSNKELMPHKLVRNFNLILDNIEENRENRQDPKLLGDLFRTLEGIKRFGTTN